MRVILLMVLTSLTACQATSGLQSGEQADPSPTLETQPVPTPGSEPADSSLTAEAPPAPTPGPEQDEWSWIFEAPVNPIQVDAVLDTDHGVEAVIPVEGGTLSATGADGTVYTLDIPADALLHETTIGLTPAGTISGLPFGGEQTYAVQFSPEGLFLYNFAVLTITPAEAIPLDEQIFFGYQAAGQDLILAAPVVAAGEIKIQVQHFSGNGVTKGLLADLEPVRERLGGSAERRLESALNLELLRIRQQGGDAAEAAAAFADALLQYEEQVVRPRVDAAGESCAAGQLAIQTVLSLERWRQLLGLSEGGDPLAKYPGLLDRATQVCVVEEFELCVEEHIIHRMVPVWLGFERQYQLLGQGDAAVLREARDLTVTCLTFKLNFESTGTVNAEGGGYESTVTSEITLRFNPAELTISGEAPLVNESFEFFMPPPCVATSIRGGGTFEAFRLIILDEPDESYGHVRDFILSYMPGNTSESASYVCDFPGGGHTEQSLPAFPAWTGTFLATHIDELDTSSAESGPAPVAPDPAANPGGPSLAQMPPGGGFITVDWEIFGDEYFARKEWIKEAGEIVEAGTFKLYHRPGE